MVSEPNTPDSWAKLETRLLKKKKKNSTCYIKQMLQKIWAIIDFLLEL